MGLIMKSPTDHVLRVFMNRDYPSIIRAEGIYLYDDQGKQYIDSAGGAIVCNLGHGLQEMAAILKEQAERSSFVYRLFFTTPQLDEAAAKVVEIATGALNSVFLFLADQRRSKSRSKLPENITSTPDIQPNIKSSPAG